MNKQFSDKELIKQCRESLQGEEEPDQSDWLDMVETLCNRLESATTALDKIYHLTTEAYSGLDKILALRINQKFS